MLCFASTLLKREAFLFEVNKVQLIWAIHEHQSAALHPVFLAAVLAW